MNDRPAHIRKEMETLANIREKALHHDFNVRVRALPADEFWEAADSVFTPEELAGQFAEWQRRRLFLKLDIATFAVSVFFIGWFPPETLGLQMLLISLSILSFFGIFVFFFLTRSSGVGFDHEFRHRLEVKKEEES